MQNKIFAALSIGLFVIMGNAWAQCPAGSSRSGAFCYSVDGGQVTVTEYIGPGGDVVIPHTINTMPVVRIGDWSFYFCHGLTSVTIPDSVTSIGSYAFHNCDLLTSVTIPDSVTNIGYHSFTNCTDLTSIIVDTNNLDYSSQDGVLYNKDKSVLVGYPTGKTGGFTIPDSVAVIGDYAFYVCRNLTSLVITNSVTSIGYFAFAGCTNLPSATIPDSVISIGAGAFDLCENLTRVSIPDSVSSIGAYAFYSCTSLSNAYFLGDAPSMGSFVFDDTAPDFNVCFTAEAMGFTTPTWAGYPAADCTCLHDSDCDDDDQYCTGTQVCDNGACGLSGDPCGLGEYCDEPNDRCVACLDNNHCPDDGLYCTGTPLCTDGACGYTGDPCGGDAPVCDETGDQCVECLNDTHCNTGYKCSGTICVPAGTARIDKATVKAGRTTSSDSIQLSGWMNATAANLNAAMGNDIIITIDSAEVPNLAETTFTFPVTAATVVNGKYKSLKDAVKAFSFDTINGSIKFSAKNVELTGLGCPITVTIKFGDFAAQVQLDETIVNGAKPCPLPLLMGVSDTLNATKVAAQKGNTSGTDSIKISGGFTVDGFTGLFNLSQPVIITLGPDTFTVPGGDFSLSNGVYSCKRTFTGNAFVSVKFDTLKCTYSLQIKDATISGSGNVAFSLNVFGTALLAADTIALPPGF